MAKFDLKKAILENKATFFSSLTEGQFSWMTQDTGQQIGSQDENQIPVYMFDDKGKYYYENDYDGYGVFGGMDYYELLDKMNGGSGDRSRGIDLAFGKEKTGSEILFPALVTKPDKFNYRTHNFAVEAETDPNQSWYEPEEDDFYDQNDEEEYGYNDEEEELDENKENLKESVKILDRQADLDQAYFNLDVDGKEMSFTYWDYAEEFDNATYEEVMYMIEKQLINTDKYGFPVDPQLTPEQKEEIAQVVLKDLQTNPGWKSNLKENNETKPTTKMKKSDLKAKIKEMILNEMEDEKVVDVNDETPESEEDFLAELEGMLNEAEGLTPLQDYVYQYEIEISGEDEAQEFLDDIRKLKTPQDVYDYYAYDRDWSGSMDDDLENIFRQVKRKFKNLNEASEFDTNKPARIAEFLKALDLLVYDEYHAELYDSDEVKQAYDLLVKAAKKLENLNEAEGDEEVTDDVTTDDVAVDDTETIDTTTTTEVNPDVKAVQDSLTQAQAAAQKLGDPKLTDQIGNTITFFTRNHVVEKGAVAENLNEADEIELGNMQYVLDWWEELPFEKKKEIFHKEHEAEDDINRFRMNESMFPMLNKILK